MQSSHPAHLFQSSSDVAAGQRRAIKAKGLRKAGRPIFLGKRQDDTDELAVAGAGSDGGKAKCLDSLVDGDALWTAESGGIVRRTDLRTGKSTHTLTGHNSPVCALGILRSPHHPNAKLLISAGWDKTLRVWSISSLSTSSSRIEPLAVIENAHSDFVKAICPLDNLGLVVSGGSDKILRLWDLNPLLQSLQGGAGSSTTGPVPKSIGSFSEHTRAITCIVPLLLPGNAKAAEGDTIIYSADSLGRIIELSLKLDESSPPTPRARLTVLRELRGPETSIADLKISLVFNEDDEDGQREDLSNEEDATVKRGRVEVWVASLDKTARRFVPWSITIRSQGQTSNDEVKVKRIDPPGKNVNGHGDQGLSGPSFGRTSKIGPALGPHPPLLATLTLSHPDHVKCLLPFSCFAGMPYEWQNLVVTGGADEDVRVWDVEDGNVDQGSLRECKSQWQGHWHEIEGLQPWRGIVEDEVESSVGDRSAEDVEVQKAVAEDYVVSTSLDGSIRRWKVADLATQQPPPIPADGGESEASDAAAESTTIAADGKRSGGKNGGMEMTEEEERELAELMGSDDEL